MKKISSILLLSVAFATAATAPKAEQEVLAAMDAFKEAMIHKDGAALDKLLASDLTYVHSEGQLQTKAEVIQSITSGKTVIERMDYSDSSVRFYGKTALVKCRVELLPQLDQYCAHERAARLGRRSPWLADGGPPGYPAQQVTAIYWTQESNRKQLRKK